MSDSFDPSVQRPPSFMRRFAAKDTTDSNTLVGLACDDNYWVRRQVAKNPATPTWILELLVRAGATPDLRGKGEPDPTLDEESLAKLVEGGPWAQQLVAEHPNTPPWLLEILGAQPSVALRLAVALHPNTTPPALAKLCCDGEEAIRAAAVSRPDCPNGVIELLVSAGASLGLGTVTRPAVDLDANQLRTLAGLGPWGRFLASRHTTCPSELLKEIATDPDWRVRSGLLDNPNTPEELIQAAVDVPDPFDVELIRHLSRSDSPEETLSELIHYSSPEVRMSLARHPAATAESLALLATDGIKEIRRLAASHPRIRAADLQRLERAGSTQDLMGLRDPDPRMSAEEIHKLLHGGIWARQLAVRHPNTSPETLTHLLCDREAKIREWAAVHCNLPAEARRNLIRAGSSSDFQGIAPPDPALSSERLRQISALGSWGEWVVANNPHAPADLLDALAQSDDWQVRLFAVRNSGTSSTAVMRLEEDPVEDVRRAARDRRKKDKRVRMT